MARFLSALALVLASLCLVARASTSSEVVAHMPDGTPVEEYTLRNAHGLTCKVLTYGGVIHEVDVPDRKGVLGDVVLGFDRVDDYFKKPQYFGALVGRVCNRIAQGKFTLNGKVYSLPLNAGTNHIHGGFKGFSKVVWTARTLPGAGVELSYVSRDGEEGYPGTVHVSCQYSLGDDDTLKLEYRATTDKPTPLNLTNHSFWNLSGGGSVLGEVLTLHASRYVAANALLLPSGETPSVAGGPMDFRSPKAIGRDIDQLTNSPKGYDSNWIIDASGDLSQPAAELYDTASGRDMVVYTDQPGVQFYTGNSLTGALVGKKGVAYRAHESVCLETQHFPDSVNHPNFPSTILNPGESFHSVTIYRFSTR